MHLKYAKLIAEFYPKCTPLQHRLITKNARKMARSFGVKMSDELNVEIFYSYMVFSTEVVIKRLNKLMKAIPGSEKLIKTALEAVISYRDTLVNDKESIIKECTKKGFAGKGILYQLANREPHLGKILSSTSVNTIGDLFVAETTMAIFR